MQFGRLIARLLVNFTMFIFFCLSRNAVKPKAIIMVEDNSGSLSKAWLEDSKSEKHEQARSEVVENATPLRSNPSLQERDPHSWALVERAQIIKAMLVFMFFAFAIF